MAFYSLGVLIQDWKPYDFWYHHLVTTFPENCFGPRETHGVVLIGNQIVHKPEVCRDVDYIAET